MSDSAALVLGRVSRDATGAVTAITPDGPPVPLTGLTGAPLQPPEDDAEGLAIQAMPGPIYISFELVARIGVYDAAGRLMRLIPAPPDPSDLMTNSGLEALALAPDGALFTLAEGDAAGRSEVPLWRYRTGAWERAATLAGRGTWRPVGADFGPDGRLYILERDYWPLLGARTRIRRETPGAQGWAEEILLETPAGRHGNLEGIAIWTDAAGGTHATLVNDNNFLPGVPTTLVDYLLPD